MSKVPPTVFKGRPLDRQFYSAYIQGIFSERIPKCRYQQRSNLGDEESHEDQTAGIPTDDGKCLGEDQMLLPGSQRQRRRNHLQLLESSF